MNFRIIKYSSLIYLFSTVANQLREVSIHTPSPNPSFKALDDDVYYATKEKVVLERLIKIRRNFRSVKVWLGRKQRKFDERPRFKENCKSRTGTEKNLEWTKKQTNKHKVLISASFFSLRLLKERQSAWFNSSKAGVYCVGYFWNVLEMLCRRDWGRQGQALSKKLYATQKRKIKIHL